MLPCIFIRINDVIYNANCIKLIQMKDRAFMSHHGPIVKIILMFREEMDIPTMHFFSYCTDFGQMMYDWKHSKASFFELSYLEKEDVEKMEEKYKNDIQEELGK